MGHCYDHGDYSGWSCPACNAETERREHQERVRAHQEKVEAHQEELTQQLEKQHEIVEAQVLVEIEHLKAIKEQNRLKEAEAAELGTCTHCGQKFVEKTRVRPSNGWKWTGRLGGFAHEGVCPRCYHERCDHNEESRWVKNDWEEWVNQFKSYSWTEMQGHLSNIFKMSSLRSMSWSKIQDYLSVRERLKDYPKLCADFIAIGEEKENAWRQQQKAEERDRIKASFCDATSSQAIAALLPDLTREFPELVESAQQKRAEFIIKEEQIAQQEAAHKEATLRQATLLLQQETVRINAIRKRATIAIIMSALSFILGCGCMGFIPLIFAIGAQNAIKRCDYKLASQNTTAAIVICCIGYVIMSLFILHNISQYLSQFHFFKL